MENVDGKLTLKLYQNIYEDSMSLLFATKLVERAHVGYIILNIM